MPVSHKETRISGKRFNRLYDELVAAGRARIAMVVKEYTADGYPPLHQPVSPREQYELLLSMRNAGDPRFFQNPAAMKALNDLAPRFYGRFPPPIPQPEAPMAGQAGIGGGFGQ